MTSNRRRPVLAAVGAALCAAAINGPAAWAQPDDPAPADPAAPAADDGPSSQACTQFSAALNYAAANYEDFAYNSAGGGNAVNYDDPNVHSSNVVGRTALREAAATAWGASKIPGLQPDIAGPMQSWSLHATKLVLVMGLRGGGDTLNNTANDLNTDARATQMACALAGTPV